MISIQLPDSVGRYFAAKGQTDPEATLSNFTEDAVIHDNGEDLTLTGKSEIRTWLTDKIAGYKLTTDVQTLEEKGSEIIVGVAVSGDFPGSPYAFENRFRLRGDLIEDLAIDPIGPITD